MIEKYDYEITKTCIENCFVNCNVELLAWIYKKYPIKDTISSSHLFFQNKTKTEEQILQTLIWSMSHVQKFVELSHFNGCLAKIAERGFLDILKWLLFNNLIIHPHPFNSAIEEAILNNHLHVVKWIDQIDPTAKEKVDDRVVISCIKNNKGNDMIKWLFTNKKDLQQKDKFKPVYYNLSCPWNTKS